MEKFLYIAQKIKEELLKSDKLAFIDNDAIVIVDNVSYTSLPNFKNFCILIRPPEGGFINIERKINKINRYIYSVVIDIYEKRTTERELEYTSVSKYDILNSAINTLEQNTLGGIVKVMPSQSISDISLITTESENIDGISFTYTAYKDYIIT